MFLFPSDDPRLSRRYVRDPTLKGIREPDDRSTEDIFLSHMRQVCPTSGAGRGLRGMLIVDDRSQVVGAESSEEQSTDPVAWDDSPQQRMPPLPPHLEPFSSEEDHSRADVSTHFKAGMTAGKDTDSTVSHGGASEVIRGISRRSSGDPEQGVAHRMGEQIQAYAPKEASRDVGFGVLSVFVFVWAGGHTRQRHAFWFGWEAAGQ
jgi:hypothetical protein